MHREPDVGFDPGAPGSRPGAKASAKPLRHPGIPRSRALGRGILKEILKESAQGLWQHYGSSPLLSPSSFKSPLQVGGGKRRQKDREGTEKARGQMEGVEVV